MDRLGSGIEVDRLIGGRPSRWWTLAAIWLGVAFSVALGLFVNFRAQGRDVGFGAALMAMIPHYVVWLLVSPPLYQSLHRAMSGGRRVLWTSMLLAWSAVALAGSTAMSYFSYVLRHGLEPTLAPLLDIYIRPPVGPAFWAMNFSILALTLAAFVGVRTLRLRDQALWESAQKELRSARLEAQLAEAKLEALQAQINPHFLLNSLNAVAGLVNTGERERAFEAIAGLGELLQIALRGGREQRSTLGDEMDFVARYLELCKLRFGAGFAFCVSVPDALRAHNVPPLVVQPLVENAIRHGMESGEPMQLDVRAYRSGDAVVIEVEDDGRGVGSVAPALPPGHGLANVAERLHLRFGRAASLALEPRAPRGARARIVIAGRLDAAP